MSYEKTIRALSSHFEGRAMSYEKMIRTLSLHFEGTAKSYEKTIRALSLHFEGTAKSYEKTIRELSRHFEEDLLAVHSEIVRVGEAGSDDDVSEDMHCDESVSGVQEGSNDMSSESDPFLAPTYESEDSADDKEVNEQGERINIVNEPVNVRLLNENMPLTTTLPASRGENVKGGIASGHPQVEPEIRNAGSTGCHPQSPPPVVTTVESTGDCGMDVGPMKKKPHMDKQREIQAIKDGLPNKTCLRRRPRHSSLDVTPGATLPLVSDTVVVLGSREPVPVQQEEAVPVQQNVKEQAPVRVTRSKRQLLQE
ncbi:hypothetical protein IFM89_039201 [Coptis chinensis]|uniref:Uncharacterized protein n=1 Tax=Coptis chinensis TaxID=261450 RepID=A0A835I877_9MAGN|nr:hypothetical protein IFM89_039201 [Coptis chinensis]